MSASTEVVRSVANAWKTLSNALSTTEERVYGSPQLAAKTGLNVPSSGRALRFLRGLGLITYRSEYGVGMSGGQTVYMKLEKSLDEGLTAIYRHFDAGRPYSWFESGNPGGSPATPGLGKGKHGGPAKANRSATPETAPVVVADERSHEEVRAIAGPEPVSPMEALRPLRKSEPRALIEAARQYANREAEVVKHIEGLTALGIEVDVGKVMEGIKMTRDPEMELVATLLPYIDQIETAGRRLAEATGTDKGLIAELRRENGVLTKERNDLQAANRRLSERNVQLAGVKAETKTAAQA